MKIVWEGLDRERRERRLSGRYRRDATRRAQLDSRELIMSAVSERARRPEIS